MVEALNDQMRVGVMVIAGNATLESTAARIKQPAALRAQIRQNLYDQYEVRNTSIAA
jgi:hypothetical protein